MKQKTKRKVIVMLLALCVGMLLSVFMMNNEFSVTHAFADSVETSVENVFTFNLINGSTEYKVSARNKQIVEADIPETYNGLPVTQIADNGFTGCTKLTRVSIPYTVTKIGTNAFVNCTNLEEIIGMPFVEIIGNNAFAMCPKLDNLILPGTLKSLGAMILRNNPNRVYSRLSETEMNALNSNWNVEVNSNSTIVFYGNELVLNNVYSNGELVGYSVRSYQCINTDADVVLGDYYNGLPLLQIEEYAFAFSTFNSFTLRHGEIISDVDISAAEENDGVATYNSEQCNHAVNIKSYAFYSTYLNDETSSPLNSINLLVDVTFIDSDITDGDMDVDNGFSTNVFAFSSVSRITLPNSISIIPKSTFESCENLKEISNTDPSVAVNYLSSSIIAIGTQAFKGCIALNFLHIPNSIIFMGNAVFSDWGDSNNDVKQTIYFDDLYEAPVDYEEYYWDSDWLGTLHDNVEVRFKTITIVFDIDGGKEGCGTTTVKAYYHQDMPEATAPERDYYYFAGYYSARNGQGTQYYDENMDSVTVWDKKTATILYAYWTPYQFTITFDKQDGTGGSDSVIASYEQPMPAATAPEKTGHTFQGYFSQPYGKGVKYYDKEMNSVNPWNQSQNTTLYADWENKEYTVILDQQGGAGGDNTVTAEYGKPMRFAEQPSMTGWTFNGYYTAQNGQGTKFYNTDMSSARNWDIDEDYITLYAYWTQTPYTLTFDMQGGTGGTTSVTPVYYLGDLPSAIAPELAGNIFKGYFEEPDGEGRKYYNADMTAAYNYDADYNLTVYAYWEAIVYTINYIGLDESFDNPNPVDYTVDQLPLNITSFDSNGYHITLSVETIEEGTIGNIDIQCSSTPIVYNITYNLNGGISNNSSNPSTYTVETEVLLNAPEHLTLDFAGWRYNGTIITNLNGITGDITLTATWKAIKTINVTSAITTLRITDSKANINFNVAFSNNCTITISPETTYVRIYGNGRAYNINISIQDRMSDFNLALDNIAIYAHSAQYAIEMTSNSLPALNPYWPTLNLYTYNTVIIKGCSMASSMLYFGKDGIPAISCTALAIHTANFLVIQGGNGEDGQEEGVLGSGALSASGGNGGIGIISDTDVYINCSNVIIAGGLAGNGASGIFKGYGGKGAPPIAGRNSSIYVYILSTANNVLLLQSSDGEDGTGMDPGVGGGTFPTNPPIVYNGNIIKPISFGDLILRPIEGGGTIPPPTDPPIIVVPKN